MKLDDFDLAPNPERVRTFLAEKGVMVPTVEVNTRRQEQSAPEFVRKNPVCVVPVMELDDGACKGESVAICRHFEVLNPGYSLNRTRHGMPSRGLFHSVPAPSRCLVPFTSNVGRHMHQDDNE